MEGTMHKKRKEVFILDVSVRNAQISQAASLFMPHLNTPAQSTSVISTDPTALAAQAQEAAGKITALQGSHGSSQEIQRLQQVVQTMNDRINVQQQLVQERNAVQPSDTSVASNRQAASSRAFTSGVDIEA